MTERRFERVTLGDFAAVVAEFPWSRKVTEVHLHHTFRPRKADFRELRTILAMQRVHVEENGWSDIAQHVTIAPDGGIWLCRNFNAPPASAKGFNGNDRSGPFMIEMVGDFDFGRDVLEGAQRQAVLGVIKAVQRKFELHASALRFHAEMSAKSCPGSSVRRDDVVREVEALQLPAAGRSAADGPFPQAYRKLAETIDALRSGPVPKTPEDGEHEPHQHLDDAASRDGGSARETGPSIDAIIDVVADNVINLENGAFSDSGVLTTSPGEVERIFDVLGDWVGAREAAGETANILLWQHGGLVSQTNALRGAHRQLPFWTANNVYPLFFVWETGLAEIIRQMLDNVLQRLGLRRDRGITDITDNVIEELVRALHGRVFWDAMKASAERASAPGGGAEFVADRLAELRRAYPGLRLHSAGHSAGSIFMAHLLPLLGRRDVVTQTAHFLAPAIRNDLFHAKIVPLLGHSVRHLSLFTMRDRLERADNVAGIYRKSLLYLVSEALERERHAPILGMETALRADREAARIFGLRGGASAVADAIFSISNEEAAGSGSTATTHGGFDEDPATLNSVVRRILGRVTGETIVPYDPGTRSADRAAFWENQADIPASLMARIKAADDQATASQPTKSWEQCCPPAPSGAAPARPQPQPDAAPSSGSRTRRALCIGIDRYTGITPLKACVADALLWQKTLEARGYTVSTLFNEDATAPRIRAEVEKLVRDARSGDDLVLTFAGHGTYFEDSDGDEDDAYDECLCAVECGQSGTDGLVIDDELRQIFARLPEGAQITAFMDSCHSGTVTRAAVRAKARFRSRGTAPIARFAKPNALMKQAYRARLASSRGARDGGAATRRDVLFAACSPRQQAMESDGQGHFTRRATTILATATPGLTNSAFIDAVVNAFGADSVEQTPELDCEAATRTARFLPV